MAPLFPFFCAAVFIHCEGSVKPPATGLRYHIIFFSTISEGVVPCFGCLLRCSHKTNLACNLASIDVSFKLNLQAGC
jgi:hypothetical protein